MPTNCRRVRPSIYAKSDEFLIQYSVATLPISTIIKRKLRCRSQNAIFMLSPEAVAYARRSAARTTGATRASKPRSCTSERSSPKPCNRASASSCRAPLARTAAKTAYSRCDPVNWRRRSPIQGASASRPWTVTQLPEDSPIDLVAVPGVACTTAGKQYDYGACFYDIFLHRCRQLRKVPPSMAAVPHVGISKKLRTDQHDLFIDEVFLADAYSTTLFFHERAHLSAAAGLRAARSQCMMI